MRLTALIAVACVLVSGVNNAGAATKKSEVKAAKPAAVKTVKPSGAVNFRTVWPAATAKKGRGGCGSKGGPGVRKDNGDCASWSEVRAKK